MLQLSKKNRIILAVSALILAILVAYAALRDKSTPLDYPTFKRMLESSSFLSATVSDSYIYLKSGDQIYRVPKEAVAIGELYKTVPVTIEKDSSWIADLLALALLLGFMWTVWFTQRGRAQKSPSNQPFAVLEPESSLQIRPIVSGIKFADVAGIKEAREELEEIIDFLKNPKKYRNFGIRMPRGVLLIGPPGVGKTMIAKAVAGEANVPFFYQSGSAFVQIYVGMGAKRVRELFSKAKQMAPSIIFIDEIDAVGKARGGLRNDEREATLNQLLTEMDGFEDSSGVVVIAATNKIEMLDEALLRPGRFDRRIFVSLPDLGERESILHLYLKDKPHRADIKSLARLTVGFSGAALSSFVNEAAIHAMRSGSKIIRQDDFLAVKEKVLLGKKKILSFSEKEKEILAFYQAARAIGAYWNDVEFDKISLVGSEFKELDKEIISRNDMLAKIRVHLAGVAALEIVYGERFSNATEDLAKARLLAREMVELYGMGDRLIGDINDAAKILESQLEEMKGFLGGMREMIERIKSHLLEHESITKEELKGYLNALF